MDINPVAVQVERLVARREELMLEVAEIDSTLSSVAALLGHSLGSVKPLGKQPIRRGRKRKGQQTLADTIEAFMRRLGKPIRIADLVASIEHGGYETKAKNLRAVVSQALLKDKRFKNVDRGVYTLA